MYSIARRRRQTWVSVSRFGRRMLTATFGVPEREIRVIYNGPREIASEAGSRAKLRHEHGISPDERVIVSVGRLSHVKGHDVLIEAVRKLDRSRDKVRVLIAGDGEERQALVAQIARAGLEGRVELIGQTGAVDSLLHAADLFVFPSRFEGTPFAMLEAMSIGLPVIATRFGGSDEVVEDGLSGFLVPLDDPEALAATIERALADTDATAAIGARGRTVVSRFSRSAMLSETLSLLNAEAERKWSGRFCSRRGSGAGGPAHA
jgi:glycosyltransferase involved in cell wall biosynthesis